jgi:pimeloyl-ACP methyl ester carboxylesterase
VGFAREKQTDAAADASPQEGQSKGRRPSDIYAAIAKNHFIHLHYFQRVGPAETELGENARLFLKRIYWALSARGTLLDFKRFPAEGTGYMDVLAEPAEPMPWPWLSEEDLDYLVDEYMQSGPATAFIGGLNSYRAMDVNWERDPDYGRAKIDCPSLFICGEKDPVLQIVTPKSLQTMPERLTDLRGIELIPNAGHFVQQEQPGAVNETLLSFLETLD